MTWTWEVHTVFSLLPLKCVTTGGTPNNTKRWLPAPVLTIQDLFRSYLIYMGWTPDGEMLRGTAAGPLQQMDTSHFNDSISLMSTAVTTTPYLFLTKGGPYIFLHSFNLLLHWSILKVRLFDFILQSVWVRHKEKQNLKGSLWFVITCVTAVGLTVQVILPRLPHGCRLGCGNLPRAGKPRSSQTLKGQGPDS